MATHNQTGNFGEALAVNYLVKIGYKILHQNWRYTHLEVDIIASFKSVLHFIEVKTKTSKEFGNPELQVGKKKLNNLTSAAQQYLYLHPQWQRIQFDIVAITMLPNEPIEYFFIEDIS